MKKKEQELLNYLSEFNKPIRSAEIANALDISVRSVKNYVHNINSLYDGTGYPDGLKGNEIPIQARIITLADSYDAMNSKRIYRNALSIEQIKEEIKKMQVHNLILKSQMFS